MKPSLSDSPVSYPVHVARLPKTGLHVKIDANAEERAALATVHALVSVESFKADLDVTTWKKGGVRVVGTVSARIVQSCVTTLAPVAETVEEDISATFVPEGSKLAVPRKSVEGEILLDAEGEDGPEIFTGDTVDVGQLAEEFFALGINPYPRRADDPADAPVLGGDDEEPRGPLYEKLQALKKKL